MFSKKKKCVLVKQDCLELLLFLGFAIAVIQNVY